MTIDEAIKRYTDNAEYERTHGNLQGCLKFKQLVKWLKELKQLRKQTKTGHWIDHSDEGYVECSECGSATNCDGNINELHFCFSCGAKMESEE